MNSSVKIFLVSFICVFALGYLVILGMTIDAIEKQQENTLNQIMELRQDIDVLSEGNISTDNSSVNGEKALTNSDIDLIERVVAAEARGDTFKGITAVAQTIKDRGDLWNITYKDVVTAPGQFANPYSGEISEDVKFAVDLVFNQGCRVSGEPITHFHADYVNPYWAAEKISRGKIGAHNFYY